MGAGPAQTGVDMNWKHIAVFVVLALLALWRIDNLKGQLKQERTEHSQTQKDLADAISKGNGWKTAYNEAIRTANAQSEATQACLDREMEAAQNQQERKAVLQGAQPRQRTEQEKTEVVDDDTRKRFALRFNRPL